MEIINKNNKTQIIETTSGPLQGFIYNDVKHFLGIKYGQSQRFRRARKNKWDHLYNALSFGPECYQPGNSENASEDCLYLNIWSKDNGLKNKPVFVYIHGGSYMNGAGSEPMIDGYNFALNQDVIVVNFNYRLGVFGFLDFSYVDEEFESNLAIKDMELALEWIKENIEAFGGDPENITISGESAGGTSVMLIYSLERFDRLYTRAISMSGISSYFVPSYEAHYRSDMFLEFIGANPSKKDLLNLDAKLIAEKTMDYTNFIGYGASTFCPVIEGYYIEEFPLVELRNRGGSKKDLLIGVTNDEMSMLTYNKLSKEWGLDSFLKEGLNREKKEYKENIKTIYKKYNVGMDVYRQIYSDLVIKSASLWFADEASRRANVWMYRFDYATTASRMVGLKAFHASDLPLIFGNYENNYLADMMFSFTRDMEVPKKVTAFMQKDFADFARGEDMDWSKVEEKEFIAKCYDVEIKYENLIKEELIDEFFHSNYYEEVFTPYNRNIRYKFPRRNSKREEDLKDLTILSNLFKNIKPDSSQELVEIIYEDEITKVERIISSGQTTTWQIQDDVEFVYLLQGEAKIETLEEVYKLQAGDGLKIDSKIKHRVSYTSEQPSCIWLCFYQKTFLNSLTNKINFFTNRE